MSNAAGVPSQTPWRQQRPAGRDLVLDHVAHFVPDMDGAAAALARLGFALTPFSAQQHRLAPDAPLSPAGSGNRCAMLRAGYLEFLTPTADTPVAQRMRAAIGRYTGLHLVCFGTNDAPRVHAHLARAGFDPQPPVALQREIGTPSGSATARFTVLRVAPEQMPEGRIQVVEHHTPELLWQARWLDHPNRAAALRGVIICVDDPAAVSQRYARFTDVDVRLRGDAWAIATARGTLILADRRWLGAHLAVNAPTTPWIAAPILESDDLAATRAYFQAAGIATHEPGASGLVVEAPAAIGGFFLFQSGDVAPFAA